jgi:hypothetical protein
MEVKTKMIVAKLVIGIISIVLSLLIFFQSCAVGVANTLNANGEIGGSGGVFLGVLFIVAGIIGIATRKSPKKGGSIAAMIVYLIAALLGFASAGSYSDLYIWAGLSVAFAIVYLLSALIRKTPPPTSFNDGPRY